MVSSLVFMNTVYLTIVTFGTVTVLGYICLVYRVHSVVSLDKTLQSWEFLNSGQLQAPLVEFSGAVTTSNVTNSSESWELTVTPASKIIIADSDSPETSKAAELLTTVKLGPTGCSESSTTAAISQPTARTVKLKISDTKVTRVVNETKEPHGHIFVYSSFEEQTNGARSLWQLEMWAKLLA